VLTQLQGKLDELDDRIVEDRRMIKALERWSSCMAAAGYRYEDPDEIGQRTCSRRLVRDIVGPLPGQFADGAGTRPEAPAVRPQGARGGMQQEGGADRARDGPRVRAQAHSRRWRTSCDRSYEARFREQNQKPHRPGSSRCTDHARMTVIGLARPAGLRGGARGGGGLQPE
jgi:hypothetical protein